MNFDDAFVLVHGIEGNFGKDPRDKGNWTGGRVGVGELKGTKYGISAAAYPHLDIENLTLDQAKALAKKDYWDLVSGDLIPARVALGLFDAAYNEGVTEAIKLAQTALKISTDGHLGPGTLAALQGCNIQRFAREFAIARIVQYASLGLWAQDHNGWTGRVLDIYRNMLTAA
jgi:lysozyme family protein